MQKNLVYVTGLTPTVREDELTKTLRRPEFFGQYGNIQKISISNRKGNDGQHPSLGVYVTFEKPEEAERCIRAVNGSQNGDRVLRAQLGTTKYCSAWLKHEQCTNRGCMFLHERGDEEDSYSRQDLSSMNSIHTQRPISGSVPGSSRSAPRQQSIASTSSQPALSQPHPPPGSQTTARPSSREGSDNGADNSALPSSANWARNPRSRRGSQATSGAAPSPAVSTALPVTAEAVQEDGEPASSTEPQTAGPSAPAPPTARVAEAETARQADHTFGEIYPVAGSELVKRLAYWKMPEITAADQEIANSGPPMFDPRGGEKRARMRQVEEVQARARLHQEEQVESREPSEEGEPESSGSLALGGEPEDRQPTREAHRPDARASLFGPQSVYPVGSRTITPQSQQMFMRPSSTFNEHLPPGIAQQAQSPFQQQGHSRQTSRYSFASGDASGSTSVNLAANPRIMAQQKSMMPSPFASQTGGPAYPSSIPGPPPGLKSTGTPPNMFGQGSFSSGSPFSAGPKDNNESFQNLVRGRGGDAGKREFSLSPFSSQYPPSTSTPAPASGFLASLYGSQPGGLQDFGPRQKKKGKKHRQANTSSSGGSGLVDLADPSILRAGMGHQSQSNAGVGQGMHGGQTHGGYNPVTSMMYNSNAYPRW